MDADKELGPGFSDRWRPTLAAVIDDERGHAAVEYAVLLGLIVAGSMGAIYTMGTSHFEIWAAISTATDGAFTAAGP